MTRRRKKAVGVTETLGVPAAPPSDLPVFFAVCGFAFIVRLAYLFQIESFPLFYQLASDSRRYDDWARQIAAGDWLGRGVFYQAPLYPYFLGVLQAMLGHDLWLIRVIQILLGAVACGFLYLAGKTFFSRNAGIAAALILSVYAPAIFFDGLIQKTVMDNFFMTLILAFLGMAAVRPHWTKWLGIGMILGLLGLTRENALILMLVIPVWVWIQFRQHPLKLRLTWMAVFLAGVYLVLFPVGFRNLKMGGEFKWTTSQFGANFYIGNNPSANGRYAPLKSGHADPDFERQDAADLAEQAVGHSLLPGEVSAYWFRRALDYIRAQPLDWLKLMWKKWLMVWNARELEDADDIYLYQTGSWILKFLGCVSHFGLLAPLAAMGIVLTWKDRRKLWLLHLLLMTFAFSVAVFYIFGRYRFPMVPVLSLFAGSGLIEGYALIQARKLRPVFTGVAAGLIAFAFVQWPILGRPTASSAAYSNLGNALSKEGRFAEAVKIYEQALRLDPTDAVAHYNLGNVLIAQDKLNEAVRHFQEAVRIYPDYAEAHSNLGAAFASQSDFENAVREFRRALELSPSLAEARYNLGKILAKQGHPEEALDQFQKTLELNPNASEVHLQMGRVLAVQGYFDKAIHQFQEALRIQPESAEAHANLSQILALTGKKDEARMHYQEAQRIMNSAGTGYVPR